MSEADKDSERGWPKYDKTTLALKIGHFLGKMANIKIGTAIPSGDCSQRQQAEDYLILHKKEWDEKNKQSCKANCCRKKIQRTQHPTINSRCCKSQEISAARNKLIH